MKPEEGARKKTDGRTGLKSLPAGGALGIKEGGFVQGEERKLGEGKLSVLWDPLPLGGGLAV